MTDYEVAIVGGGPVGSLCAVAHARRGARVALVEVRPNKPRTLAGEWLHPRALRALEQFGIHFSVPSHASMTDGFVVFPEDGSEPILLPYPNGIRGLACDHEHLVLRLREAAANEPNVDLIAGRVRSVDDGRLTFTRSGVEESVTADRIIGADGRASIVRRSLGWTAKPVTLSRMVGIVLNGVQLPVESYGHVVLGAPGAMFLYRLNEDSVRINLDVPLSVPPPHTADQLLSSYAPLLPEEIRPEFASGVREGRFSSAANMLSPRISYGRSRLPLIGDAAGHYHPMTAVGLTLGFEDAIALAEAEDFDAFAARRLKEVSSSEMLAIGFYEIMNDSRAAGVALRHAVYRMWRTNSREAERSMALLACERTSVFHLAIVGAVMVTMAVTTMIPRSISPRAWLGAGGTIRSVADRVCGFIGGVWSLRKARANGGPTNKQLPDALARALPVSMAWRDRSKAAAD